MRKKIALLCLCLVVVCLSRAQTINVDSLEKQLIVIKDDSLKVQVLAQLAFHYIFNDSKTAWEYIIESERIAKANNLGRGTVEAYRVKAIFYDVTDKGDSAFHYFSEGYALSQKLNLPDLEVKFLNGLGMNCWTRGQYNIALEYFFKVLEANQALEESKRIPESTPINNIGLIYQELALYDKALEYHSKALEIRERDPKLVAQVATSYNNIGICLTHLEKYDQAEGAYRKGIKIARERNFLLQYYTSLDNLANTLVLVNRHDEALNLYLEVLNGEKKIALQDKFLMNVNAHVAGIFIHKHDLKNAGVYLERGFRFEQDKPEIRFYAPDLYRNAAILAYMNGDTRKGKKYADIMTEILEERFARRNAESTAEMEIRYETAMKENQILKLQTEKEEAELKRMQAELLSQQRQRTVHLTITACVLVLAGAGGWYRWNQFQNNLIETQKINNAIFLTEQNERVRIARDIHDSIGQKLSVHKMMLSKIEGSAGDPLKAELKHASQLLDETVHELRSVSHNLIPQELNLGLLKAIEETAERINETEQVSIVVNLKDEAVSADEMPVNHQLSVYRIIQEILNNMLKHAQATNINIAIGQRETALEFSIHDNGKGFNAKELRASQGIGWKNIIARARLISAQLRIKSEAGSGTSINLIVPITA